MGRMDTKQRRGERCSDPARAFIPWVPATGGRRQSGAAVANRVELRECMGNLQCL